MPPTPSWYRGRDAVLTGLRTHPLNGLLRWRLTPTRANGQVAVLARVWEPAREEFVHVHTAVLTLREELIAEIETFIEPAHLRG
jgi:RNA polymerase sigma-70 factor (ECF subfamily)